MLEVEQDGEVPMERNCRQNVPLAGYTTLGLGGPARLLCVCSDPEAVRRTIHEAQHAGRRLHVLGGGSNTVFLDGGFDGTVLRVGLKGIAEQPDNGAGVLLRVAAGEDWDNLVQRAVRVGLAGLECLSGIPGSVGATPMQNVGAYGQEVRDSIAEVEAIDLRTLEDVTFRPDECGFGYRTSRFKERDLGRYLITHVTFRLRRGAPSPPRYPELARALAGVRLQDLPPADALSAVRGAVLGLRRRKAMLLDPEDPNTRSAGSFFTNPVLTDGELERLRQTLQARLGEDAALPVYAGDGGHKVSAAWLIERAGFARGYRRQGAAISERHTLALVNRGGSTRDLLDLAGEIQERVEALFGVQLRREPVVVGEQE